MIFDATRQFIVTVKEEERLVIVLEGLDAEKLLAVLEREHWTERNGHSIRGLWAALIAGIVHQSPSLAGVVRLLKGDKAVREVCGLARDEIPDEDALGKYILGILASIFFLVTASKLALDIIRSPRKHPWYGFGVGTLLACLATLIVGIVESSPIGAPRATADTYYYIISPVPWILLGLLISAHRLLSKGAD